MTRLRGLSSFSDQSEKSEEESDEDGEEGGSGEGPAEEGGDEEEDESSDEANREETTGGFPHEKFSLILALLALAWKIYDIFCTETNKDKETHTYITARSYYC